MSGGDEGENTVINGSRRDEDLENEDDTDHPDLLITASCLWNVFPSGVMRVEGKMGEREGENAPGGKRGREKQGGRGKGKEKKVKKRVMIRKMREG